MLAVVVAPFLWMLFMLCLSVVFRIIFYLLRSSSHSSEEEMPCILAKGRKEGCCLDVASLEAGLKISFVLNLNETINHMMFMFGKILLKKCVIY